jgi:hypothetical protein
MSFVSSSIPISALYSRLSASLRPKVHISIAVAHLQYSQTGNNPYHPRFVLQVLALSLAHEARRWLQVGLFLVGPLTQTWGYTACR